MVNIGKVGKYKKGLLYHVGPRGDGSDTITMIFIQ